MSRADRAQGPCIRNTGWERSAETDSAIGSRMFESGSGQGLVVVVPITGQAHHELRSGRSRSPTEPYRLGGGTQRRLILGTDDNRPGACRGQRYGKSGSMRPTTPLAPKDGPNLPLISSATEQRAAQMKHGPFGLVRPVPNADHIPTSRSGHGARLGPCELNMVRCGQHPFERSGGTELSCRASLRFQKRWKQRRTRPDGRNE